jgi:hypothetical protein
MGTTSDGALTKEQLQAFKNPNQPLTPDQQASEKAWFAKHPMGMTNPPPAPKPAGQ